MFVLKSYAIRSPLVCAIPRFFINTLLLPKLTSKLSAKTFIFSYEILPKFKISPLKPHFLIKKLFINYIEDNKMNRKKNINNPMEEFYANFFKNIENVKYYKENKNITLDIMKKNSFFLNYLS